MFKIIFHILHFFGIGCFYNAKVKVILPEIPFNTIRIDKIEGYSFSKNPIKDVEKIYKDVPSFLIHSMEIVKVW